MPNDNRTDRLKELMDTHHLKAKDVGAILEREPHTVRVWRSAYAKRVIPAHALRTLELELEKRQAAVVAAE